MNYTSNTLKYITKNFLYVILFAAVPAVFFALATNEEAIRAVLNNLLSGKPQSDFWTIFHTVSIFNFSSKKEVISGLIGILVLILCIAMLTAFLEKHMRIGKRTLNGIFVFGDLRGLGDYFVRALVSRYGYFKQDYRVYFACLRVFSDAFRFIVRNVVVLFMDALRSNHRL